MCWEGSFKVGLLYCVKKISQEIPEPEVEKIFVFKVMWQLSSANFVLLLLRLITMMAEQYGDSFKEFILKKYAVSYCVKCTKAVPVKIVEYFHISFKMVLQCCERFLGLDALLGEKRGRSPRWRTKKKERREREQMARWRTVFNKIFHIKDVNSVACCYSSWLHKSQSTLVFKNSYRFRDESWTRPCILSMAMLVNAFRM